MTKSCCSGENYPVGQAERKPRKPRVYIHAPLVLHVQLLCHFLLASIGFVISRHHTSTLNLTSAMPLWSCPFREESMATGFVSTLTPLSALAGDQFYLNESLVTHWLGTQLHWDRGRGGQCFTISLILNLAAQLESPLALKKMLQMGWPVSSFG